MGEGTPFPNNLAFIRYAFEVLPKQSSDLRARMAMDMLYDEFMGLNTREVMKTHPMSTVRLHDAERQTQDIGLEGRIRLYAKSGINKYFQLSLEAFLALPTGVLEMVVRVAREMGKSDAAMMAEQRKQLEATMNQNTGQNPAGRGTTAG